MQSHYLVENRHIAVKHCRHGIFMYNRNDSFVGRSLDLYGEWCDFEIQLLRSFIKSGDTVIDVGANIGTHAVAFGNMVGPTGTVHAFEPQRRLFTMLAGNVALNALDWVICHRQAVGDRMGEIHLPPLPPAEQPFNYAAVSLVAANAAGADGTVGDKVPLVTLDSLELGTCALLKVDVEGMNTVVLSGAQRLIAQCEPVIYCELDSATGSKELEDFLKSIDYCAYWSIHPYYDQNNFYNNDHNIWANVVWCLNLICLPRRLKIGMPVAQEFLGAGDDWLACLRRMQAPA
jgi:FkbM family methyltransferase